MKNEEIIVLGLAAVAVYFILKNSHGTANTVNNLGPAVNGISQIFTGAQQGDAGYGWKYYTDGTAIDPQGNYYYQGVKVWPAA